MRQLNRFKLGEDDVSLLYMQDHEATVRQVGPLLMHSGLIDDVMGLPAEINRVGGFDDYASWMKIRYANLRFSKVFVSCFYGWGLDDLATIPMFADATFYTTGPYSNYVEDGAIKGQDFHIAANVHIKQFGHSIPWGEYGIGTDIDRLTEKFADPNKRNVYLLPESSDPMRALHPEGLKLLLDALLPNSNVWIGGNEKSYMLTSPLGYSPPDQFRRFEFPRLRQTDILDECIDVVGFSCLKQLELMRRMDAVVVTTTGAVVLPEMYGIPYVLISGSNYDISSVTHSGTSKTYPVKPNCDRWICDQVKQRPMRSDCRDSGIPQCYAGELALDRVMEAIDECCSQS
jgi:hypothetical protein